jgi:hypothetical protein
VKTAVAGLASEDQVEDHEGRAEQDDRGDDQPAVHSFT